MPLSPPPLWQQLLLEDPLPLTIAFAALALILALLARRAWTNPRRKLILYRSAGLSLLLAATVYALATFVTTTRERILQETRLLLAAAAPLDDHHFQQFQTFFDPAGQFTGYFDPPITLAQTLDMVRERSNTHAIREHKLLALAAQSLSSTQGLSVISIQTTGDFQGIVSIPSQWRLEWSRTPDGQWKITRLTCLSINNMNPRDIPH